MGFPSIFPAMSASILMHGDGGGGGCCGGGGSGGGGGGGKAATKESGGGECCKGAPHEAHAASGECCKTKEGAGAQGGGGSGGGCCGGSGKVPGVLTQPMTVEQLMTLPTMTLIARFRRGIEVVDRRVFDLTERQIDQAFLPEAGVGRWPVRVLIGHCADAELAYAHRIRRAIAEEKPMIAAWDENAFVDSNIYGNRHDGYSDNPEADEARVMHGLGGFLAVIHTLRQWMGQWLMTLDESAFDRTLMHPERGEESVRRMIALSTWHLEHHCGFLTRKLDKMVITPRPEAVEVEGGGGGGGGGCGSGCGCH